MAEILTIANAVVSLVNSGQYSQAFTAVRRNRPLFELKELKTLQVSVVPKGLVSQQVTRTGCQYDYDIDLAVQKAFATGSEAETDPLLGLIQEVADFLRMKRLDPYIPASWIKMENTPIFIPQHFDQNKLFTSVLTLTYRVTR